MSVVSNPPIEDATKERVDIGKINIDNEADLAAKYNVSSIPTLLVMKDGEEANRFIGVTAKAELAQAITDATG